MPSPALADDDAIEQAQGGIQRRRPVAHIVVRLAFRHVRSERQHRARAMQGLNAALLVDAKHHRFFGRTTRVMNRVEVSLMI